MQYCAIVNVTFDISMFMYIYKKSIIFLSSIDVCYIICVFVVTVQKCQFISSYLPVNEKGCISSFLSDYFLSKILFFMHQIISILNRTIFSTTLDGNPMYINRLETNNKYTIFIILK